MSHRLFVVSVLVLGFVAPIHAAQKTYKYDQYKENIEEAAAQVGAAAVSVQAGYSAGEAFGILVTPAPSDYPVKILGLDILLAAPPGLANGSAKADIEVWLQEGTDKDPGKAEPDFTISTDEFYNSWTGGFGVPLEGNKAFRIDFDWLDANAHPPIVTQGNFRVVVRFKDTPQDLGTEWGNMQCGKMPEFGMCGCQEVGTIHDTASTPGVNVVHFISPLGSCSGGKAWHFANELGITGDYVMRVRAGVPEVECVPDCANKECGSDLCGGTCGTCGEGLVCSVGKCEQGCEPMCTGKECGDDGCGGDCGACPAAAPTCDEGVCKEECQPQCDGRECGDDGCGGDCGTCPNAAPVCEVGLCKKACVPACDGKECGDDGCGGTCGTCPNAAPVCEAGVCVEEASCHPQCDGLQCGNDGCGGTCGTCESGSTCQEGQCTSETPEDVVITGISPNWGSTDEETAVSITGAGFVDGASVKLGAVNLNQVVVLSAGLIEGVVPSGLQPGVYMLVVLNPDGSTVSLPEAFEVREPAGGGASSGGCAASTRATSALALLAALMVGAWFWMRRTR